MARIALTLIRKNPDLADCTTESFLGALMTCSQLGFEPGSPTQEAFIIPRQGQAEFQLGYQGMVTLFYQHPMASSLKVETVHENDHFEHEEGLEEKLVHRPCPSGPPGRAVAYYSVARLINGGRTFKVMYPDEIEERKKKSSFANSPAWRNHYDEMAKKTVLRNHFKALPKSAELARAMAHDGTVRTDLDPSRHRRAARVPRADTCTCRYHHRRRPVGRRKRHPVTTFRGRAAAARTCGGLGIQHIHVLYESDVDMNLALRPASDQEGLP
ncbi:recombinase RecT [Streptomyces sp. NPDC057136]|uniref:recombinase RecT n=1 Tax=Streptomyces sp. NPDC057136 TaxID=3346029 RepID=UPI003630ED18